MKPTWTSDDGSVKLWRGDCREILGTLPESSVSSCVTDPPYALTNRTPDVLACTNCQRVLGGRDGEPEKCPRCGGELQRQRSQGGKGFMGKSWDVGDVAFDPETWRKVLRVAKPGAFLLAFGGSRTSHRLVCAIEDAGWEIRDGAIWIYGSGFPKSHDVGKAIDKAAGAERELGPKRVSADGTVAHDRAGARHGGYERPWRSDAEAVDRNTRVSYPATDAAKLFDGWGTALSPAHEPICVAMKPLDGTFAANALKHGVAGLNIDGARIGYSGDADKNAALSGDAFKRKDTSDKAGWSRPWMDDPEKVARVNREAKERAQAGRWPKNVILSDDDCVRELFPETTTGKLNRANITAENKIYGTAPKQLSGEYEATSGSASRYFYTAKAGKAERRGSAHPTVKPLSLIEYLCTLTMTPTGGVLLDCFLGSGTSAEACIRLGRPFIGIELDPGYFDDAVSRVKAALKEDREQPTLFDLKPEPPTQEVLF